MARRSTRRTQVAVVMYPGLLPLELIGTVSALNGLGLNTGFRPVTVAARQEPLATDTRPRVFRKAPSLQCLTPTRCSSQVAH